MRPQSFSLFKSLSLPFFAVSMACSIAASAQPDVQVTRLLFEPRPVPENAEETLPLVSFNNATEQVSIVPAAERQLTLAERNAIEESIEAYVLAVGDLESEEGPYSNTLREDLFSAGLLAQQIEDHERAVDFFNRAQSVSRINNGLESLDQIDIMHALAESRLALGQNSQADDIQQSILTLTQTAYGDGSIEEIPAMLDFGVWHMDAFLDRSNILLNIDRMNVAQFMFDPQNYIYDQGRLRDTPLFNLYQAQQTFLGAIQILLNNKEYFHPRILELEQMLLKTYFLSIHRENILYEPDFFLTRNKRKTGSRLNTNAIELMESDEYQLGQASHTRSVAYLANDPDRNEAELAAAMLEAADWHLLFERKVVASREYNKVYDFYNENPELGEKVREQLYPEFPVVLPVYLPPPNSREKLGIAPDESVNFFGYYDISFNIDKYGKAKKVRIQNQGGEVNKNIEIRLMKYMQEVLFRPRYSDGKVDTDNFTLRYYIGV